jgi:superfamily II DNA or RNA helicase
LVVVIYEVITRAVPCSLPKIWHSVSFQDLEQATNYNSAFGDVDVIKDFYNPVLEQSIKYDRVAGYFSSRVFASAAKGISGLVRNNGKMRLLTSHAFTKSDTESMQEYFASEKFSNDLLAGFVESYQELGDLTDTIAKNHIAAMCWMLNKGYLEIKVIVPDSADLTAVTPEDWEKFHPKFGIFYDSEGNSIAFAGSVNETALAWNSNIENFDVYHSWIPGELDRRISPKMVQFEKMWKGEISTQWRTIDLPAAVKDKIISEFAPSDFPRIQDSVSNHKSRKLRDYQNEALESWIAAGRRGILEMATGTGKTRTAKACIESSAEVGSLLTIVIVPYQHIGDQWKKELGEFSPITTGKDWRKKLATAASQVTFGRLKNLVIVAVKNTAASEDFIKMVRNMSSDFDNVLLVGDEVHWLGAPSFQSALISQANFRLGLSATPKRYFDEIGTDFLLNYFGESVYQLTIRDALKRRDENGNFILCPYKYKPITVSLSQGELERYQDLTRKIGMYSAMQQDYDVIDMLQKLRNNRSFIAKTAESKIPAVRELLEILPKPLEQCLIYCADFAQLNIVARILEEMNIPTQQITGLESANASINFNNISEREHIIKNFANGSLGVLLAIDCLDEGVDIPSAKLGIILASSGNEKEFIQRRGRLMRPFEGKDYAEIYDFCVLPIDPVDPIASAPLVNVELSRIEQFALDALNSEEILDFVRSKQSLEA